MSDENVTINCGGCGCFVAIFLLTATIVGSAVIVRHVIWWWLA